MYADYEKVENQLNGKGKVIGKSYFGRNIYAYEFGSGEILVQGGMHAREHITTELVLEMIKYNSKYALLKNICFIPLMNPDGVELAINGIESVPPLFRDSLLAINGGSDFSLWKANGRAVDLNLNFDADWGKGLSNVRYRSPSGYIGLYPESESETKALVELTNSKGYALTFSFHAKGEELYSGYKGYEPDSSLTKKISESLGYPSKSTVGSTGGYKDWCVLKKGIPAYTIEFGKDNSTYTELYNEKQELFSKCVKLLQTVAEYER